MGGDLGGRGAGHQPALLFGLRLWASVCLSLFVAFWLPLNNPFWAGTSGRAVWELPCSAATPSLELSRMGWTGRAPAPDDPQGLFWGF